MTRLTKGDEINLIRAVIACVNNDNYKACFFTLSHEKAKEAVEYVKDHPRVIAVKWMNSTIVFDNGSQLYVHTVKPTGIEVHQVFIDELEEDQSVIAHWKTRERL